MQTNKRVKILEIPIDCITLSQALEKIEGFLNSDNPHQVATVNPEFIIHALENGIFEEALLGSSLNTADGIGTIWASKFLKLKSHGAGSLNFIKNIFWLKITLLAILFNRKWLYSEVPERITGINLVWKLAERAEQKGWSIFLLGGRHRAGEKTAEKLTRKYPALKIAGVYEGDEKDQRIFATVPKVSPDILFVAFGSPKQEIFIHKNLGKLGAKLVIGVGGSYDFIAGKLKRAPKIFRKLGIEWLWRFGRQPSRYKRMFNAFPKFVWNVFVDKN